MKRPIEYSGDRFIAVRDITHPIGHQDRSMFDLKVYGALRKMKDGKTYDVEDRDAEIQLSLFKEQAEFLYALLDIFLKSGNLGYNGE